MFPVFFVYVSGAGGERVFVLCTLVYARMEKNWNAIH